MKQLLVATDLSARSDRALQRAILLANEHGARLAVVHVIEGHSPDFEQQHAATKGVIEAQIIALQLAKPANCLVHIAQGRASLEILRLADEIHADLIVLGIHRHAARERFRGTTAEQIVSMGHLPVLVVKDAVVRPYRHVLVPVDLSVHSRAAMELAATLAPRGEVYLLHATHAPFTGFLGPESIQQLVRNEQDKFSAMLALDTKELTTKLGGDAPRLEVILKEGDVRPLIRDEIDRLKPDLLVLGTHGRSGISYALLGSVAEDMLCEAPADVLAVKAW